MFYLSTESNPRFLLIGRDFLRQYRRHRPLEPLSDFRASIQSHQYIDNFGPIAVFLPVWSSFMEVGLQLIVFYVALPCIEALKPSTSDGSGVTHAAMSLLRIQPNIGVCPQRPQILLPQLRRLSSPNQTAHLQLRIHRERLSHIYYPRKRLRFPSGRIPYRQEPRCHEAIRSLVWLRS